MSDKVFRDPLYNYVCIDKAGDGWLLKLLDTPEVQRLRRIHQLGVSNFTYPGADHNRLAHSLGVVYLMQQVLEHLKRTSEAEKIKGARMRLLAAALLHDVGHGPFSHLFEPCLGIAHEKWSIAVVRDSGTNVHKILSKEDPYLPQQVADLIEEKNPKPPPWQKALLSSQLDVDRLDYLRRDSLFTGAGYGHFDWFRLLTTVQFHNDSNDLVWPEKSALAIEEYIFARYYMYRNVYHHKTTRGFEQLLQAMWKRATGLRDDGHDVSPVPALARLWEHEDPSPEKMPIECYLDLEECAVISQIQVWKSNKDHVLADLAKRFLNRDGFAMIEPPISASTGTANIVKGDDSPWESALKDVVEKAGFTPAEAYCLRDKVDGKYRQPYRPEPEPGNQTATNSIRILIPGEAAPKEISKHLDRLGALTSPPTDHVQYYVPKEAREAAKRLRGQCDLPPKT